MENPGIPRGKKIPGFEPRAAASAPNASSVTMTSMKQQGAAATAAAGGTRDEGEVANALCEADQAPFLSSPGQETDAGKVFQQSQQDTDIIQQLQEKIIQLETEIANLQARLKDCIQDQTLDTSSSSSSQGHQTLEEGIHTSDQQHSSDKPRQYGFVEARRGSVLENTLGTPYYTSPFENLCSCMSQKRIENHHVVSGRAHHDPCRIHLFLPFSPFPELLNLLHSLDPSLTKYRRLRFMLPLIPPHHLLDFLVILPPLPCTVYCTRTVVL